MKTENSQNIHDKRIVRRAENGIVFKTQEIPGNAFELFVLKKREFKDCSFYC